MKGGIAITFDIITAVFAICFLVGLLFSIVSLVGGAVHVGGGHSLGHFHGTHAGTGHHGGHGDLGEGISVLNFSSATIFIAWFGGVGFCLRVYGVTGLGLVIVFSLIGGVLGAYLVYLFLSKVLLKGQSKPLSESDTYMPGTAGRVSSRIAPGGTGEIIYAHLGTRRSSGAKSIDGSYIPKGTQVVILKYEKGIAYVKPTAEQTDTLEN